MIITFTSLKGAATGDAERIRVRRPGDLVHFSDDGVTCNICGRPSLVWTDRKAVYVHHAARCERT